MPAMTVVSSNKFVAEKLFNKASRLNSNTDDIKIIFFLSAYVYFALTDMVV